MTYSCTNAACGWKGDSIYSRPVYGLISGITCPLCDSPVEDLDLLERKAIRQDAGFSEKDAERLAIEDLKKWREALA